MQFVYLAMLFSSCQNGSSLHQSCQSGLSGSGRDEILKNCRASIEPDAGAKSRFSVSYRVFTMAGIKQREHLVVSL